MIAAFLLTSSLLAQHENTSKHSSRLLALPGELRNHIYAFCIESSSPIRSRGPRKSTETRQSLGDYGSLMHVCHQMRTEFSPIYFARTPVVLHQPAVNLYIQTFYPGVTREISKGESRSANLEDRILPAFTHAHRDWNVQGNIYVASYFGFQFNAAVLIYLCMLYPNIRVHFREAGANLHLAPDLDAFFAAVSTASFRPDMQRTFEAVTIRMSREPLMVFLTYAGVKIEDAVPAEYKGDVQAWLVSQGCPAFKEFCVRIVGSKTLKAVVPAIREN